MYRRAPSPIALVILVVTAVAGCSPQSLTGSDANSGCAVADGARLAPDSGALFGVNLDWSTTTLEEFSIELGERPAVAVSFTSLPMSETEVGYVRAAAAQVHDNGGMLLLTLEPRQGLSAVTPTVVDELAQLLAGINDSGVPVIVRFAHEMNGSWYPWSQRPQEYVAAFREVASVIHREAPGSALMWAPNYGGGYPFTGGEFGARPDSADYAELDTDRDGIVSMADDAYSPYYPGDEYVDWVGMSLYHWGASHPWGENTLPEEGKFAAQLTGNYRGTAGDETAVVDFYQVFGVDHGKPVAIPETAAFVIPRGDTEGETAIKKAWWRQVVSPDLLDRFPGIRMVNWFEWNKFESEVNATVDWTVASDAALADAFRADLPPWLVYAGPPTTCPPE